jgi:hypothetical protein
LPIIAFLPVQSQIETASVARWPESAQILDLSGALLEAR